MILGPFSFSVQHGSGFEWKYDDDDDDDDGGVGGMSMPFILE